MSGAVYHDTREGDIRAVRDVCALALGRIFRLCSRPEQPGDVAEYERCRAIFMDNAPTANRPYEVNYARDRNRGAQGD